MSKHLSSGQCFLCGDRHPSRDYEYIAPVGRFIHPLCVTCRTAIQEKGWPIRAYPPRNPTSTEWLKARDAQQVHRVG